MNRVILSPEYFPSPTKGVPISLGSIYVGEPDTDPTVVINQKQISVQEENGTITPVSQPILTGAGGIPMYNGSPVTILVDGDYSLRVNDSLGTQVYYVPSQAEAYNEGSPGAVDRPVEEKLRDFVSIKDFGAVGDGVTDDTASIQAAIDSGATSIYRPEGVYLTSALTYDFDVSFTGPGHIFTSAEFQTDQYGGLLPLGTKIGNTFPLDKHGGPVIGGEGPTEHGVILKSQRVASMDIICSKTPNPLELQLYPNKVTGFCTTDGVTATLTYSAGFDGDLDSFFFVGDTVWVGDTEYTILAKPTTSTLTLDSIPPVYATGVSCFVLYETIDSVIDVSGTAATWVSGEKFPSWGSDHNVIINNARISVTVIDDSNLTLATPPGDTQYSINFRHLSDEKYVELLRFQRLQGSGVEETLSIVARPDSYRFRVGAGGTGRKSPIHFYGPAPADDPFPINDDPQTWLALDDTGKIGIHKTDPESELHLYRDYNVAQGGDDTTKPMLRLENQWNGIAATRRSIDFDARNNSLAGRIQGKSGASLSTPSDIEVQQEGGDFIVSTGAWDAGLFRLGSYHLWVDATGDLRIKNGAPTSDLDGTVVGAQS